MSADALDRALAELIGTGEISPEQGARLRDRFHANLTLVDIADAKPTEKTKRAVLGEIGGYIGGGFTLVAVLLILGESWRNLTDFGRALTLGILALIFFVVGYLIHQGGRSTTRSRLVATLALFGAIAITGCVGVSVPSYKAPIAFTVGLIAAAIAYLRNRTSVGHIGFYGFSLTLLASLLDAMKVLVDSQAIFVFVLFAAAWYWLSSRGWIGERVLGYALASATTFIMGEIGFANSSHRWYGYFILFFTAVMGFLLYSKARHWPALVAGVAALTFGVGQLVAETLHGALGVSIGLLAAGLALLGASAYIFRSRKR